MAQQDTDSIFREIDEDLRNERYAQLWKKYGALVLIAALALVLGVAGFKAYESWQQRRAAAMGGKFNAALRLIDEKKPAEAEKALQDLAQGAPAGYRALAKFRLAAADAIAGRPDAAVKTFEDIANDRSIDDVLRGLARIRAAMLRLDTADWTEMQNRLNDLKGSASAWRFSARELLGLAAWKAGKLSEAEKEFLGLLGDRGTPQNMQKRAELMMALLLDAKTGQGAQGGQGAPAAAANQAAPAGKAGEPAARKPPAKTK